jgi:hypothetical protein
MKKCLYLCGPMTGLPEYNYPAFANAAEKLTKQGHYVLNPARFGLSSYRWEDYMRRGLSDLLTTDAVALLPGWEQSTGARLEVYVAQSLGMPCCPLDVYLDEATEEIPAVEF